MRRILILLTICCSSLIAVAQCPPSVSGHHRVQKGETLYQIAKIHQVTVAQLCEWNQMKPTDILYVCQELAITAPVSVKPGVSVANLSSQVAKQEGGTHVIQQGETIAAIAKLYGYTEARFRRFNGLDPTEPAWPGLVLKTTDCVCPPLVPTEQTLAIEKIEEPASKTTEAAYPSWQEYTGAAADKPNAKGQQKEDPFLASESKPESYEMTESRISPSETVKRSEAGPVNEKEPTPTLHPDVKRSEKGVENAPDETYLPAEELLILKKKTDQTKPAATPPSKPVPVSADYMKPAEVDMINEINLLRSDPPAYASIIEAYQQEITSGKAQGSVERCQELIRELNNTPSLALLEPSPCLYRSAIDYLEELTQQPPGTGEVDGYSAWNRIRTDCPEMTYANENVIRNASSVRNAIIRLLMAEDSATRVSCKNLLKYDWKYVSCAQTEPNGFVPGIWLQQFGK